MPLVSLALRRGLLACGVVSLAGVSGAALTARLEAQPRGPDVPFATTPPEVVEAMVALAGVGPGDRVYDLGCGDGRIVVAAAWAGAQAVGIDIDPALIAEARARARREGVADRATFRVGDLFEADFSDATVVMLYLQPEPNLRLRPRLLADLRPGTRVVSHSYDMGDWAPDTMRRVAGRRIYLWTIPAR